MALGQGGWGEATDHTGEGLSRAGPHPQCRCPQPTGPSSLSIVFYMSAPKCLQVALTRPVSYCAQGWRTDTMNTVSFVTLKEICCKQHVACLWQDLSSIRKLCCHSQLLLMSTITTTTYIITQQPSHRLPLIQPRCKHWLVILHGVPWGSVSADACFMGIETKIRDE